MPGIKNIRFLTCMKDQRLRIHLSEAQDWRFLAMEQFLYRIQPVRHEMLTKGATEIEARIVSEHFNYLKRLTDDGVVILAGRTQNTDYSSFGIVLFKAETLEAAREIMLNDPAVKNNVFRAELYPYKTSLFNPNNVR